MLKLWKVISEKEKEIEIKWTRYVDGLWFCGLLFFLGCAKSFVPEEEVKKMLNELISEDFYWFYLILAAPTPPNVREIIRFRLISAYSISWFHTIHKFIHIFFIHFAGRFSFFFGSFAVVVGVSKRKGMKSRRTKSNKTHNNSQKFKTKKKTC